MSARHAPGSLTMGRSRHPWHQPNNFSKKTFSLVSVSFFFFLRPLCDCVGDFFGNRLNWDPMPMPMMMFRDITHFREEESALARNIFVWLIVVFLSASPLDCFDCFHLLRSVPMSHVFSTSRWPLYDGFWYGNAVLPSFSFMVILEIIF